LHDLRICNPPIAAAGSQCCRREGVEMTCPACGSRDAIVLGVLGARKHYRCRACGIDYSRVAKRAPRRVSGHEVKRPSLPLAVLDRIIAGQAAAPHCDVALPRACPRCGVGAVLPLDAHKRAQQPDGTTHVCHPLIGGCNHGFTEA
jgi:Zn ribbon nucleic-acid-binding protein